MDTDAPPISILNDVENTPPPVSTEAAPSEAGTGSRSDDEGGGTSSTPKPSPKQLRRASLSVSGSTAKDGAGPSAYVASKDEGGPGPGPSKNPRVKLVVRNTKGSAAATQTTKTATAQRKASASTPGSSKGVKRPRSPGSVADEEDELGSEDDGAPLMLSVKSRPAQGSMAGESAPAKSKAKRAKKDDGPAKKAKGDGAPSKKKGKTAAAAASNEPESVADDDLAVLAPLLWIQDNIERGEPPGQAAKRYLESVTKRTNAKKSVRAWGGELGYMEYHDPERFIQNVKRDDPKEWKRRCKERAREIAAFGTYVPKHSAPSRTPSPEPEDQLPTDALLDTTTPTLPDEPINLTGIPQPSYPLPTKPFPVMPPLKLPTGFAPLVPLDREKDKTKGVAKVRGWRVAHREIRGIAGGRFFLRTWVGAKESEWATRREEESPAVGVDAPGGVLSALEGLGGGVSASAPPVGPKKGGRKTKVVGVGDASSASAAGPRAGSVPRKNSASAGPATSPAPGLAPSPGAGTGAVEREVSAAKALTKMRHTVVPSDVEATIEDEIEEDIEDLIDDMMDES